MDGVNSVNNNDSSKPIKLKKLKKMDEVSIFNKLDTDKSGNISDEELVAAGFLKKNLIKVKEYLISRFGTEKINNNIKYFNYTTEPTDIQIIKSYDELPQGSHDGIKDARRCDISGLELTQEQLLDLCIDKTTIMSPEQKAIIDTYMEKCKNPGLGIRELHTQGITGKGVHMAIIDQPLGKHQEYDENIRSHTNVNLLEVPVNWSSGSMHGAAVTSIAVGKSVGVAPDASVDYYSAINLSYDPKEIDEYKKKIEEKIKLCENSPEEKAYWEGELKVIEKFGAVSSNTSYANAIIQILDKNRTLPKEEQVSVISISWGFDKVAPGYEKLQQAISRAKEEGVFVVSTALEEDYGFETNGANRNPQGNIDSPQSYEAGAFWKKASENEIPAEFLKNQLLFPMDHRTVADYQDGNSYRYEGNDGGMSWSTPWLAGMYVLAKQVDSNITPEDFWKIALETADECKNNDSGRLVGKIVNPQKLIEAIQTRKVD